MKSLFSGIKPLKWKIPQFPGFQKRPFPTFLKAAATLPENSSKPSTCFSGFLHFSQLHFYASWPLPHFHFSGRTFPTIPKRRESPVSWGFVPLSQVFDSPYYDYYLSFLSLFIFMDHYCIMSDDLKLK